MDTCIDHPDNLGVFQCQTCSRQICDQHPDLLCEVDNRSHRISWAALLLILGIIVIFSIISYYIYVELSSVFNEFQGVVNGDVVTIDGETQIVTSINNFPDLGVILLFALIILTPFLISILIFVRRQIMKYRQSPEGIEEQVQERLSKSFYCQSCGEKNTTDHANCVKCGKSTQDERDLIK